MNTIKKFKALVVDDDSINRAINMKFLGRNGFEIIKIAKNGQEAVEYFHAGDKFDLVVMDMEMPIMDGIQATKEIRAMGVKSLIIGMSASSSQAKIQEFVSAGLDDFYAKPMNMAKLAAIMGHPTFNE
ncbi:two-component response regulator 24 [Beta vulgaris subsp. vulgaris]|uniref:two-component response regulator 24 n=1 Tax=Beta vulgaris subsp. vulgaris TaxID=3555 RepID=UPI0020371259|nr:two-component response regulator 24 [Beta vulgaris subsp. vulgaris]